MPYRDTERARAYQRDYRRIRRSGDACTTPVHPAIAPELRLKNAQDVLTLLAEQAEQVQAWKGKATEKARTIGYLAGLALRAIEAGNLAARLEALEQVLKQRPNAHDRKQAG